MKTIKITVTDENGIILDTEELEVKSDCNRIAVREIPRLGSERLDETTIAIGV